VIWGGTSPPCSFHGESWIRFTLTAERFLRLPRYEHQIREESVAAVRWAPLPVKETLSKENF